jgi:hypothetical protein
MFNILADVVVIPIQKCKEIKKNKTPLERVCVCICARVITMHVYIMYAWHDLQYQNMTYISESKSYQHSTVHHIQKLCAKWHAIDNVNVSMRFSP